VKKEQGMPAALNEAERRALLALPDYHRRACRGERA